MYIIRYTHRGAASPPGFSTQSALDRPAPTLIISTSERGARGALASRNANSSKRPGGAFLKRFSLSLASADRTRSSLA